MKRRNIISALACSIAAFAFTACTDVWEEHYQPSPELNADETLWELIANDSALTDFAAYLRATGYDTLLTKNRFYTVWAPVNGADYFKAHNAENKDMVGTYRKEFVENHIADYSHVAGGKLTEDNMVKMLNGKYISFENASGKFEFKGIALDDQNIPAKNGILHKIGNNAGFTANIWEQLAKEESLDSLWNFLYKDYKREPNWSASVQGPMVDGKIQYLDTAWSVTCPWWSSLGRLNREDSSYTMFAPTNRAWNELYEDTKRYFNYAESFEKGDSVRDVVVKEFMVRNLVFSDKVNKKYAKEDDVYPPYDSLVSNYNYAYTYEPLIFGTKEVEALYDGLVGQPLALSNGTLNIVDKLNYDPLLCWHDSICLEGESLVGGYAYDPNSGGANPNDYAGATKTVVSIHRDSLMYDSISGGAVGVYRGGNTNPSLTFKLKNVLSARYIVQVVVLSPDKLNRNDTTYIKPNKFIAKLICGDKEQAGQIVPIVLGRKDSCDVRRDTIFSIPSAGIDIITLVPMEDVGGVYMPTGKDYVEIPTCEYNEESLLDGTYDTKLEITSALNTYELERIEKTYMKAKNNYSESVVNYNAKLDEKKLLEDEKMLLEEEMTLLEEELATNPENSAELEEKLEELEKKLNGANGINNKLEYAEDDLVDLKEDMEKYKAEVEKNDRTYGQFMDNTLRIDQVLLVPVPFDE